jgi:hypothetical protein
MVRFGHRRRLSLQACLQVEALRAETRYLLANTATANSDATAKDQEGMG